MTSLDVSGVAVQDDAAWCQVLCRQGILRGGDGLTSVRHPDGSTFEVDLVVELIEVGTGPVTLLETYSTARLRIRGTGVEAIQPGSRLENVSQWQFAAAPELSRPDRLGSDLAESDRPALHVEEPTRLGRWSTGFRLVLIVPHYIALLVLGFVAEIVVVIGWFGALATGRLPAWSAEFLQGYVDYQTRVYGYLFLLTDKYPSFDLAPIAYPVRTQLPPAGRLNRWSVLLRALLAVPANLLGGLAVFGWCVCSLVIWLVVLVTGRYPATVFRATFAVLRFSLRVNAYALLLTSRYPRGLFGDGPPPVDGSDPPSQPVAIGGGYKVDDDYGSQPGQPVLSLSSAAKRLIGVFLTLGVLAWSGTVAVGVVAAASSASPQVALRQLQSARAVADVRLQAFQEQTTQCKTAVDQLTCVQKADAQLATGLSAFGSSVGSIRHPSGTDDLFSNLSASTRLLATAFLDLSQATSADAYSAVVQQDSLSDRGSDFDNAYAQLVTELSAAN